MWLKILCCYVIMSNIVQRASVDIPLSLSLLSFSPSLQEREVHRQRIARQREEDNQRAGSGENHEASLSPQTTGDREKKKVNEVPSHTVVSRYHRSGIFMLGNFRMINFLC